MKYRSYCFIVNPVAGTKSKKKVLELINHIYGGLNFKISFTKCAGHATELAHEAVNNFDVVVAVGGDGTVNEVSKGLINTNALLGILPMGSGNGLARHLGVPLNIDKALHFLLTADQSCIDTCLFNSKSYTITSGLGFEAQIASLFAKQKGRGLFNYIRSILQSIFTYQAENYDFELDGTCFSRKAFTLSVANANQYGNNTFINPLSDLKDGMFEVCILRKFGFLGSLSVIYHLFNKSLDRSRYYEVLKGRELKLKVNGRLTYHLDGEPLSDESDQVFVSVLPNSLRVLADSNNL